ncbi:efflux RND transporter permease subunit, partial [Paraburkholderia mimosarum]|uniref:efflux RND transporter permease subunit n=1 Tax=Paraburkholderia mimosarum TaxID=312026 RepID=UPI0005A9A94D
GQAILKAPKADKAPDKPGRMIMAYDRFLRGALRMRWLTLAVTLAAFVVSIFLVRFVPQQFFPASDRPELTVDLTLRQNASIHATEAQVARIEAILKSDPDVDHFSSYVGRGAVRFILTLNAQLPNPFFAQIVVVAKNLEARDRLQLKLEKVLSEQFPGIVARVSPLELGPPVGWPLQYRVSGPDPAQVRRVALDLAGIVGADSRTRHVNFDWMEPARQIRIHIDQDEARQLGVSSAALAAIMNTIVTGTPITQIRDDIYLVNVVARADQEQPLTVQTLGTLQVPTPAGRMVPLSQFATFTEEQESPLVWRRNRVPTLTVRADVMHGALPN